MQRGKDRPVAETVQRGTFPGTAAILPGTAAAARTGAGRLVPRGPGEGVLDGGAVLLCGERVRGIFPQDGSEKLNRLGESPVSAQVRDQPQPMP